MTCLHLETSPSILVSRFPRSASIVKAGTHANLQTETVSILSWWGSKWLNVQWNERGITLAPLILSLYKSACPIICSRRKFPPLILSIRAIAKSWQGLTRTLSRQSLAIPPSHHPSRQTLIIPYHTIVSTQCYNIFLFFVNNPIILFASLKNKQSFWIWNNANDNKVPPFN